VKAYHQHETEVVVEAGGTCTSEMRRLHAQARIQHTCERQSMSIACRVLQSCTNADLERINRSHWLAVEASRHVAPRRPPSSSLSRRVEDGQIKEMNVCVIKYTIDRHVMDDERDR
jgi:hypothetical protein